MLANHSKQIKDLEHLEGELREAGPDETLSGRHVHVKGLMRLMGYEGRSLEGVETGVFWGFPLQRLLYVFTRMLDFADLIDTHHADLDEEALMPLANRAREWANAELSEGARSEQVERENLVRLDMIRREGSMRLTDAPDMGEEVRRIRRAAERTAEAAEEGSLAADLYVAKTFWDILSGK